MKKRNIIVGFLIVVLLGAGFFAFTSIGKLTLAFIVEDVTRDPFIKRLEVDAAREDLRWGVQIEHDPKILGAEFDRAGIESQLERSGFSGITQLESHHDNRKIGDFAYGTDMYGALVSGLPCQKYFVLFLWFDDADMLSEIKSAQFEAGCL